MKEFFGLMYFEFFISFEDLLFSFVWYEEDNFDFNLGE